jgi:hypothetical protein
MVAKKKRTRIVERERGVEQDKDSDVLDRLEEVEARLDRLERGQLPAPEPPEPEEESGAG